MARYRISTGEYIEKSTIDARVRKAKAQVLAAQLEQEGFNYCTTCKRNDCLPVTCAHIISVDRCQKEGTAELAWDPNNIIPEGMKCHQLRDGLYIG